MRPHWAAVASGAKRALGEPGELAVRIGFYVVILAVFTALWRVAMDANGGAIAGYDYTAMMWYIVAAEGAVIATKPRMIEEIGTDIATGAIAVDMLRPVSVVAFRLAVELGEAIVRLIAAVIVGGLLILWRVGPPPEVLALVAAVPVALLGVAVNLCAQYAFAGVAFWLEDAKSGWFLYQKLIFLLGGMLLPLELVPHWLATTARFFPFWTMCYVPARFMSGNVRLPLVLVQLGWLAGTFAAAALVFRLGERRLQVAGG